MTRKFSQNTVELAALLADQDFEYLARLRQIREQRGLSTADVATKLGVSETAIHNIEAPDANPTLNTLRQYALAIGAAVTREVTPYDS